MVECLPSMGEAPGSILDTTGEKGKEGGETGIGGNWYSVQKAEGMEGGTLADKEDRDQMRVPMTLPTLPRV